MLTFYLACMSDKNPAGRITREEDSIWTENKNVD